MRKPHKSTVAALRQVKGEGSLRGLSRLLNMDESWIARYSDVLRQRESSISVEQENKIRLAMGLRPLTQSGRNVYRNRVLSRPVATLIQEYRRRKLNISWRDVIEKGLLTLEAEKFIVSLGELAKEEK